MSPPSHDPPGAAARGADRCRACRRRRRAGRGRPTTERIGRPPATPRTSPDRIPRRPTGAPPPAKARKRRAPTPVPVRCAGPWSSRKQAARRRSSESAGIWPSAMSRSASVISRPSRPMARTRGRAIAVSVAPVAPASDAARMAIGTTAEGRPRGDEHSGQRRHRNLRSGPPSRGHASGARRAGGSRSPEVGDRRRRQQLERHDGGDRRRIREDDADSRALRARARGRASPTPEIGASARLAARSSRSRTTTSSRRPTGSPRSPRRSIAGTRMASAAGSFPRWEAAPPRWLAENESLLARLAIMDFEPSGLLALPLGPSHRSGARTWPFAARPWREVGEFDPRLGVVGKKLYRAKRADLIQRALELGLKIAYDPALTVFHRIGPDRVAEGVFSKAVLRRRPGPGARDAARRRALLSWRAAAALPPPVERR